MDLDSLDAATRASNLSDSRKRPANFAAIAKMAFDFVPNHSETVTAVSETGVHKSADGTRLGPDFPAYLFLFPFHMAVVREVGTFKKRLEVSGASFDDFKSIEAANEDFGTMAKAGEYAIQFRGPGQVPLLRLSWGWFRHGRDATAERLVAATERDRVLAYFPGH